MAMMVAALGSFVVKIIAFMIVLVALGHSTAFNGRMLGFTALACILAWSASQVVTAMKLQMLYVEPRREELRRGVITGMRSYSPSGRRHAAPVRAYQADAARDDGLTMGTGWTVFSYLISGMLAYGGIGWVIGHFTHVSLLFPIGMLVGLAISVGWIIYKYGRPHELGNPPKGDDR